MNVIIISIDHHLQLLEAEGDSEALSASKTRLREGLEEQFGTGQVASIFEECSLTKESIAAQLARRRDPQVPWHNICMTADERKAAGIYESLNNRPGRPDDQMEYTIQGRIPEDEVREDYFAEHKRSPCAPR